MKNKQYTYTLKDGRQLLLRPARPSDAAATIDYINRIDSQTRFMTREPGEFAMSVAQEEEYLRAAAQNEQDWV